MRPRIPLSERFWKKVSKQTNGCWVWVGLRNNDGYGRIKEGHKEFRCSRVSWELHNGKIPKGMLILHSCDNPPCVNPNHLRLGTQKDNVKEREMRGHGFFGSDKHRYMLKEGRVGLRKWGKNKLMEWEVEEIRLRYRPYKVTAGSLAKEYGVSRSAIYGIVFSQTWISV